ncbi:MAG: sensor histidine kinase [Solirubrobacterales bacterium]
MLGLVGVFVYGQVSRDLDDSFDTALSSRADDLAALVASSGSETPTLAAGRVGDAEDSFSQILTPAGAVIATNLPSASGAAVTPEEAGAAMREPSFIDIPAVPGIEGEARLLARSASSGAGAFVVVVGASTEDKTETQAGVLWAFLVGAPLALVLASLLGYFLASRALRPVDAMRRRARAIDLERSGERLPLPRANDEIHALGATLNSMLDRIEASLERERVFVADASHELRTPLAILRAELDLADRAERTPDELRVALTSAAEEVDRLSRLAEDLLVIARSDQGSLPIQPARVSLADVLERVRRRYAHAASARGSEIVVEAPSDLLAELDAMRVEQALGNLADNALRHGAGGVRLIASQESGNAVVDVTDQGDGFPAEFEDQAFERFTRADAGRTGGGAGLGLAIVRAIASAHGGEVSIEPGAAGETTVRMVLPLKQAPAERHHRPRAGI